MIFHERPFIDVDLTLRRGAHINRSSLAAYEWTSQNFDALAVFYSQYGCDLHQHPDGFYFMTVNGSQLRPRILPKACVHLGIFLALKARDPEILRSAGRIPLSTLMQDLETSVPKATLREVYAPQTKEVLADDKIVEEIQKALKILDDLNFIELSGGTVRPLEALARFAEIARHDNAPDVNDRIYLETKRGLVFDPADSQADSTNASSDGITDSSPSAENADQP